jgi:hypothetical protein
MTNTIISETLRKLSNRAIKSIRLIALALVAMFTSVAIQPAHAQSSDTWKSVAIIGGSTAVGAYVGHKVAGPPESGQPLVMQSTGVDVRTSTTTSLPIMGTAVLTETTAADTTAITVGTLATGLTMVVRIRIRRDTRAAITETAIGAPAGADRFLVSVSVGLLRG